MYIDVKPIEKKRNGYRGLERLLDTNHFKYKNNKMFNQLLEMYFDYISYTCVLEGIDTVEIFNKIRPFYSLLIENGASCEIIISNKEPIVSFNDEEIEFLGIDIVNEYHESLLLAPAMDLHKEILNKNFLFKNIDDCAKIKNLLKEYTLLEFKEELEPQYIYKVIC